MYKLKLKKKQIADALIKANGQVFIAAELLGCSAERVKRAIERSPRLAAVIEEFQGKMVDTAVLTLKKGVMDGESWAVRLALTSLGKERGFGKSTEMNKEDQKKLRQQTAGVVAEDFHRRLREDDALLEYCRSKHMAAPAAANAPSDVPTNTSEPPG
jgi:hypothetical protein